MVNPNLVETVVKEFVQKYGPVSVVNLKKKTGFKKCWINSILHKNSHYLKVEKTPLSLKNTRPVWSWSDEKVNFRVMSTTKVSSPAEN